MNVLVTGAAGYVGSVCAEVLIAKGHRVIALDNLPKGTAPAVPAGCDFQHVRFFDTAHLDRIFRTAEIHAVMHFAAEALVEKSVREPSTFYRVNLAGGIQLLDAMIRHGVKKLSFLLTPLSMANRNNPPSRKIIRKRPLIPTVKRNGCLKTSRDYARYPDSSMFPSAILMPRALRRNVEKRTAPRLM